MKKELAQWVSAQVCLHSCMTGLRMAAPLMLLRATIPSSHCRSCS